MKTLYTIAAWILFIAAIAGIIFSAYGLFSFWRVQNEILSQLLTSINLVDKTISTTQDGLTLVTDVVEQAKDDLDLIESMTYDISDAVGNTRPTLESTSKLFGEDLSNIVVETQNSLAAAESSAILIDDTLRIIAAIPLLGTRYAPSQPLGESIGLISDTLGDLPESLSEIEEGLDTTSEDLASIESSIDSLASRIGQIDSNLEEASVVLEDYQAITEELHENLRSFNVVLPNWFRRIVIAISALFAWICIASFGLFSTGLLMWKHNHG